MRRRDLPGVGAEHHAAGLHYRLVHMHPFWDGNGRMARALATWLLAKETPKVLTLHKPINSVLLGAKDDYLEVLAHCDELYAALTERGLDRNDALAWAERPFVMFYLLAFNISLWEEVIELGRRSGKPDEDAAATITQRHQEMRADSLKEVYTIDRLVNEIVSETG